MEKMMKRMDEEIKLRRKEESEDESEGDMADKIYNTRRKGTFINPCKTENMSTNLSELRENISTALEVDGKFDQNLCVASSIGTVPNMSTPRIQSKDRNTKLT